MSDQSPSVYLLHGNDEYAIRSFLEERLKPKMGEETTMDITTVDGGSKTIESIKTETQTVPFLTERRMVVIQNIKAMTKGKTNQEKFISLLDAVPSTTALVLIEDELLENKHFLIKWIKKNPERSWMQVFALPKGPAMTHWILAQAKDMGGSFENQAAQLLASYIDENPRLAKSEIDKLLIYVDYSRPVTETDVRDLVADVRQGDVFEMVDAIGYGDGQKAMFMLRRLLEDNKPLSLFGMVIRQFRLLIQVRELMDENPGQDHNEIALRIGSHPYPIKKIMPQAKIFTLPQLKIIYHQLSEIDESIKSFQLEEELALDLLIATLTQ
ncbi:MAG: DNA polymerase III subunit delta [Anaerolineales bacterium]|nr:DNA polymerase III subunit delta [Anaerolineales bacterium]